MFNKEITIKINTSNSAFDNGCAELEIARILKELAENFENFEWFSIPSKLFDINGNAIGFVEIED